MPSRELLSTSAVPPPLCSFFFLLLLCLRKRRKRTTPSSDSDSIPPHPFSYPVLRHATKNFSTRLGQGGFGPVFSGTLSSGEPVAVKLMDSASLQGEREFHNELFFASRLRSPSVVTAMGFSSDPKRRRFLLVYHLIHRGNLHDALLRNKTPHLSLWKNRFSIILDVARGIQYLHSLDPPVIHGDIKPSNILLDHSFSAKLADFGLSRLKPPNNTLEFQLHFGNEDRESDDAGSEFETQSVNTEQSLDDYVMDWIGKEVVRPNNNPNNASSSGTVEKKKKKKSELWEEKRRPAREWWREEYSQELTRKKKKKKKKKGEVYGDVSVYKRDDSGIGENEIVGKSGGMSSSRSTRGTVFYVAPEYGYRGDVSEKCDVYSFGVLLLVIVSGRRPLQVTTGSPISEFQRANLVSWARQCARRGKLLEVMDQSVDELDKEEAALCITIALMCLLKSPARRPSMNHLVGMLTGEVDPPQLPPEYSKFPFNSQTPAN